MLSLQSHTLLQSINSTCPPPSVRHPGCDPEAYDPYERQRRQERSAGSLQAHPDVHGRPAREERGFGQRWRSERVLHSAGHHDQRLEHARTPRRDLHPALQADNGQQEGVSANASCDMLARTRGNI